MMSRLLMIGAGVVTAAALAGCQPAADETEQAPPIVERGPLDNAIAAEDLPPDDAIPAEEEVPDEVASPVGGALSDPDRPVGN